MCRSLTTSVCLSIRFIMEAISGALEEIQLKVPNMNVASVHVTLGGSRTCQRIYRSAIHPKMMREAVRTTVSRVARRRSTYHTALAVAHTCPLQEFQNQKNSVSIAVCMPGG